LATLSDLESGSLAHIIFNKADSVPLEYFQIEQNRSIYELYLSHYKKYNKTPTRAQFDLLIKQNMNGSAGVVGTLATKIYDLEEEVTRNSDFYEDLLINWKKCTVTSSKLEELLGYIQHKNGEKIDALISSLYTQLTEFSTESKDTIFSVRDDVEMFSDNDLPFLFTGYNQIDQHGGIPVTSHVLLTGPRGAGKTLLGFNFLKNMYELNDVTTIFFSLEMPREEIKYRLLSMLSGIPLNKILRKDLTDSERLLIFTEYAKFKFDKSKRDEIEQVIQENRDECINLLNTNKEKLWKTLSRKFAYRPNEFIIVDDPNIDSARIALITDSVNKNRHNLGAICVDYLQIIRRLGKADAKDALGDISSEIRKLGLTHEIVTVILAQLNKEGTMTMNSYAAEAPATLIWVIDGDEALKDAGVMQAHCTKTRGAIPRVNLDFHVNGQTNVVYE